MFVNAELLLFVFALFKICEARQGGKPQSFLGRKRNRILEPEIQYGDIKIQKIFTLSFENIAEIENEFYGIFFGNKHDDEETGNEGYFLVIQKNDKKGDVYKYGRKSNSNGMSHSESILIDYLLEKKIINNNTEYIYISTYYSPCISCLIKLTNLMLKTRINMNIYYKKLYPLDGVEKKKTTPEERKLSNFLIDYKKTMLSDLKPNSSNQVIKSKYEKIFENKIYHFDKLTIERVYDNTDTLCF